MSARNTRMTDEQRKKENVSQIYFSVFFLINAEIVFNRTTFI